jgi:hypothetical protein
MTKNELRALYIAARRWHTDAITQLDAEWKAALARIASAPPARRPHLLAEVARDLAPLFMVEGSREELGHSNDVPGRRTRVAG